MLSKSKAPRLVLYISIWSMLWTKACKLLATFWFVQSEKAHIIFRGVCYEQEGLTFLGQGVEFVPYSIMCVIDGWWRGGGGGRESMGGSNKAAHKDK